MLRTSPEFLSAADLHPIHVSTLKVMEQVGIVIPVPEALLILQKHGARAEGQRVYFTDRPEAGKTRTSGQRGLGLDTVSAMRGEDQRNGTI
jgi:hypothetical protein